MNAADLPSYNQINTATPVNEFQALDPRVVRLWRVTDLIGYGVMLAALLVSLWFTRRAGAELWPYLSGGWMVLTILCIWWGLRRPLRLYRSWGYRLDDRVLETRSGVLFQHTRLLPLSRLQHVDIKRGPLERRFGLASLILHTAGTHAASTEIPGLAADEAVRLRDHLLAVGGDDAV